MIEITNKNRSPVQLVIRSQTAPRSLATLIIPGIGKGNNVYYLRDELNTEYVQRAEHKFKLIKTRYVPNRELNQDRKIRETK